MHSITIALDPGELRRASAWLGDSARELGIPKSIAVDLEICLNEAVTNAMQHGCHAGPEATNHSVALQLGIDGPYALLRIEDDTKPFDPTTVPAPSPFARLEDAPVGGLGVHLIRNLVPQCEYLRDDGRNVLILRARLNPAGRADDPDATIALPRGPDRRMQNAGPALGRPERRWRTDRRSGAVLFGTPLFAGLPWGVLEAALKGCPLRTLAEGEVLLEPGQFNDTAYLLLSGRLLVRLRDAQAADAIVVEPGNTIGELSIIDAKPVSAGVVAACASDVAVLGEELFWKVLIPVPGFARNVMRLLADRMRASNELIVARLRERLELEHLQRELLIARDIQTSMLPPRGALLAERPELEIFGLIDAAQDIGGDLYDAFLVDPDHLLLVVGDVSGKGIPAALFMSRVVALARVEAMREHSPELLLARINAALCEHNDTGMFVTLLVAVYDLRSGALHYSNAGHLPPAHAAEGGRFSWLPLPRGSAAGMSESARFGTATIQLARGDRVLLYTDGVIEAEDSSSALYGDARLLETLRAAPGSSAREALTHVREDVDRFAASARQSDDITLLALRRLS